MARKSTYVSPSTVRGTGALLGLVGIVAAVAGPVYAINGATQARAAVEVAVQLRGTEPLAGVAAALPDGARLLPDGATQAGAAVEVAVQLRGTEPPAALPEGARLLPGDGVATVLESWESTVTEQLLSRGDAAVLGLAVGLGAWLLAPVLESIAAGRPFGGGNARRLAWLAVVVAVAGSIGPLLPQYGSIAVLDRLGLVGPASPFVVATTFSFLPLVIGGLLLVLAEAFRQGERIDSDVEGLV